MSKSKKRNIIIGSLCAIVLLMAVGYAAFQTVLNIQGTSNITSSWDIKITNVTSKNIKGTASNNGDPSFENLSATFKTNLQAPGDSIEYDITVTNNGSLNAKLDKYKLTDTNNEVIKFTQTGLTNGEVLTAGSTKTFTVKVEYLSTTSEQPSKVTSSLTITLDYSQAENGYTPGEQVASEQLTSNLVTSGDGLYEDTYEPGRYVYKGANPNNYITFNNEEWRIVAVEADGTLKIIRNEKLNKSIYYDPANYRPSSENTYCSDVSGCNAWSAVSDLYVNGSYSGTVVKDSYIYNFLKIEYYPSLTVAARLQIQTGVYKNGGIAWANTFNTIVNAEAKSTFIGDIALLSVSDWFKASNNAMCTGSSMDWYTPPKPRNDYKCSLDNYLYKEYKWWLITPYINDTHSVMSVYEDGSISSPNANAYGFVRPATHLKADISLLGSGTSSDPYTIK